MSDPKPMNRFLLIHIDGDSETIVSRHVHFREALYEGDRVSGGDISISDEYYVQSEEAWHRDRMVAARGDAA